MKISHLAVCVAAVCATVVPAMGDVKLPVVIGSNMVVQQGMPSPIWGWADKGEEVTVAFDGQTKTAKAGADGKWMVKLAPMTAKKGQKPQAMTITGRNKIVLDNILIGEVWVGSGQSNMEWNLNHATKGKETIAAANYPQIRLLLVPKVQGRKPEEDIKPPAPRGKPGESPPEPVKIQWNVCTPQTLPPNSAVLFFFGRELSERLGVPVGLISSSWGGSPIQPWTVADGKSGGMYNGMIHPLIPFAIRGVIWYQGESNIKESAAYTEHMRALIEGWRKAWGQGEFPFYYVHLAPFRYSGSRNFGVNVFALPLQWEAQCKAMSIPNTGMAVITDLVDNVANIHPGNKIDVGKRLALWALAKDYGQKDIVCCSPMYKSMTVEGGTIRVQFENCAGRLLSRDGKPLTWFVIAGEDKKFVPAAAKIDRETVVVSAPGVANPVAVRFGWHEMAQPNLMGKSGLPACPFRTDDWKDAVMPTPPAK